MTRFQFPVRNLPLPIQELATEMEHLVDRVFTQGANGDRAKGGLAYSPAMDVTEDGSQYQVQLDLPGVQREAVKIEIHQDRLTISGSRPAAVPSEGIQYHREERSFGEFRRTLILPKLVDTERIEATYQDGVLTLVIPKVPKAQPKTVEIRTAGR